MGKCNSLSLSSLFGVTLIDTLSNDKKIDDISGIIDMYDLSIDEALGAYFILKSEKVPSIFKKRLIRNNDPDIVGLAARLDLNVETEKATNGEYITYESFKKAVTDKVNYGNSVSTFSLFGVSEENLEAEENFAKVNHTERVKQFIDGSSSNMIKKKHARIEATEGANTGTSESWGAFLNVYFEGMADIGMEFTEKVADDIMVRLMDLSEEGEGFVSDINELMNTIKYEIYETKYANRENADTTVDINKTNLNNDDNLKDKYFNDIFYNEFDFILENVVKIVSKNNKKTYNKDNAILGFSGVENELGTVHMDIKVLIEELGINVIQDDDENFTLAEDRILNVIDSDLYTFINSKTSTRDEFYYIIHDDVYVYLTADGSLRDVSVPSVYNINTSNDRKSMAFGKEADVLDQGTAFINNIFSTIRAMKYNKKTGNYEYGDRLSIDDYYRISAFLISSETTMTSLQTELKNLIENGNGEISSIARAAYHSFFADTTDYITIEGSDVFSLFSKSEDSSANQDNLFIVTALASAMISKKHEKYFEDSNNQINITKDLLLDIPEYVIDDNLSTFLTRGGYTKPHIANHLFIKGGNVTIYDGTRYVGNSINLDDIDTIDKAREVAQVLGITELTNGLFSFIVANEDVDRFIENKFTSYVRKFIKIAAYNAKTRKIKNTGKTSGSLSFELDDNYKEHNDFRSVRPTTTLEKAEIDYLVPMFNPDILGNVSVGGSARPSLTLPNRNAFLPSTIEKFKKVSDFTFNPILSNRSPAMDVDVSLLDYYIKTPISVNGKILKVSEWGLGKRLEFELLNGFIGGAERSKVGDGLGNVFFVQPLGYSDKSNPHMFRIVLKDDANIFLDGESFSQEMEDMYVNYHASRYENIQQNLINELSYFIGGNYNNLRQSLIAEGANKKRLDAFSVLRNVLIEGRYPKNGDMTRSINILLDEVKLPNSLIKYAETTLEHKSDFVDIGGKHVILKPHMGIRAEKYRMNGKEILKEHLDVYNELLEKEQVDITKIFAKFKTVKKYNTSDISLIDNKEDFIKRTFIANSIYGSSVKFLTMADESAFPAKAKDYKVKNIKEYYKQVDRGERTGLEEVDAMQKAQFKRAQSNLSSGVRYMQNETIEGLKHKARRDNLLNFLEIYENRDGEIEHRYDKLKDKSLYELYAMGLILKMDDGSLANVDSNGNYSVKVKLGDEVSIFNSKEIHIDTADDFEIGVKGIFSAVINNSETGKRIVETIPKGQNVLGVDREGYVTIEDIEDDFEIEVKAPILPDSISSILVEDPISYVNLLNFFDYEQENSDGVQLTHPLLYLMFDNSRGGKFGAFHSENYEAIKAITTTLNYRSAKHQLQKKAVQMPFSMEQLTKIGNIKLWNAFKKMNTSVEFKKKIMNVPVDVDGEVYEDIGFENMQELFEHFLKLYKGQATDEIWTDIADVLSKHPQNMYAFTGYITFESTQKTGNYSENTFDNVFERKHTSTKPNLYQTNHEFNFEILTKAHSYEVSRESSLSLLTQLVNSISLGGVTDTESFNLQSAMASLAEIHKAVLAKDFEKIAREKLNETRDSSYNGVIERFSNGNLDISGLSDKQKELYSDVVREGLSSMAELAYNEATSSKFIKDLIAGSKYSLDTPAIQRSVLGTLRSNLFKETVKIKQSGFIAVVTTPHLTSSVYTYSKRVNGEIKKARQGRKAFIDSNLNKFDSSSGAVLISFNTFGISAKSAENEILENSITSLEDAFEKITPFDNVKIVGPEVETEIIPFYMLDINNYPDTTTFKIVLTPDAVEDLDVTTIDNLTNGDIDALVDVEGEGTLYAWYAIEKHGEEGINKLIADGKLKVNSTEKYSLRWYQYVNTDGNRIESTEAFKNYYRVYVDGNSTNKNKENAKALLFVELSREGSDGNKKWRVLPAEVITPNFLAAAFGLPSDVMLVDIVGSDGESLANAKRYFTNRINPKEFRAVNPGAKREFLLLKYGKQYAYSGSEYIKDIIDVLITDSTLPTVDAEEALRINNIINNAKERYIDHKASSFLKALLLNASRTPGQSLQSGFNGIVIEFLNAQGNSIMAPTEHLVTTGGDFDIDTLNVLTSSITIKGLILSYDGFIVDGKFDRSLFFKTFEEKIENGNIALDAYFEDFKKVIDERIALVQEAEMETEEKESAVKLLENLYITEVAEKRMRANLNKNIINAFDSHVLNVMKDSITGAYENIDASIAASTPMVFTIMKAIEATAIDLSEAKKLEFMTYHGESPIYNMISEEEALQGKDAISIYAVSIKMNGSIQGAKVMWENKYKETIGEMYNNEGITAISNASNNSDETYTFQGYVQNNSNNRISKKALEKSNHTQFFTDNPVNETSKSSVFNVTSRNTKVLIVGEEGIAPNVNISEEKRKADIEGYDAVVIKGYEINGNFYNIVIPIIINSDVTVPKKGTVIIDPFRFDLTIDYKIKDRSSSKEDAFTEKTATRNTFADLNENTLKKFIANTSFNRAVFDINTDKVTNDDMDILVLGLEDVLEQNLSLNKSSDRSASVIIKNVFNIDMEITSIENHDIIEEFSNKIYQNKKELIDSYLYLIGKDTIYDVQAQFMSSAVDNAKELILSKIKANNFTNSIISTMMLLGFDANTIVEFLHDPMMDKILEKLIEKKINFEDVFLSTSLLDELPGIRKADNFTKSLKKILDVNAEIFKFLSVKNLNESFKIDQFILDKINDKIATKKLYEAILKKDISAIPKPKLSDKGKAIFHPELMIFLHEQTSALFVNVYEVENSLLPSLSKIVTILRKMSKGDRNDQVYKNLNTYISGVLVDMYLKSKGYSGTIVDDEGTENTINLKDPYLREEFVTGFRDYFLDTVAKLRDVYNVDTNAFDYFASATSYGSTFSQLIVPLLNHSRPDNIKIAAIKEGINNLKVTDPDDAVIVTEEKNKFYDNLMKYALIVNSGEIKKNSLVELFPEMLFDLSSFIETLSDEEFFSIIVQNKDVANLIKGTTKTKEVLEKERDKELKKANSYVNTEYGSYNSDMEGTHGGEDFNNAVTDLDELMVTVDDEIINGGGPAKRVAKGGGRIETTPGFLVNRIFKSNDSALYKEHFLGLSSSLPALRLFFAGTKEAIFTESVSKDIEYLDIKSDLLESLSYAGYQIGRSSEYSGGSRILAYNGVKRINKKAFDMYIVEIEGKLFHVPGLAIMNADEDIFLHKNRIEVSAANNYAQRSRIDETLEKNIALLDDYVNEPIGVENFALSSTSKELLKGINVKGVSASDTSDVSVLQREDVPILITKKASYSNIIKAMLKNENSTIYSRKLEDTSDIFIPHINGNKYGNKMNPTTTFAVNSLGISVLNAMNKIKAKSHLSFIGTVIPNYGVVDPGGKTFPIGGDEIMKKMLNKYFGININRDGRYKVGNFNLKVSSIASIDGAINTRTYEFYKREDDLAYQVPYKGKLVKVPINRYWNKTQKRTIVSVKKEANITRNKSVLYRMVFDGIVNNIPVYAGDVSSAIKKAAGAIFDKATLFGVLGSTTNIKKTIVVGLQEDDGNIVYYKVVSSKVKNAKIETDKIKVPKKVYDTFLSEIEDDNKIEDANKRRLKTKVIVC